MTRRGGKNDDSKSVEACEWRSASFRPKAGNHGVLHYYRLTNGTCSFGDKCSVTTSKGEERRGAHRSQTCIPVQGIRIHSCSTFATSARLTACTAQYLAAYRHRRLRGWLPAQPPSPLSLSTQSQSIECKTTPTAAQASERRNLRLAQLQLVRTYCSTQRSVWSMSQKV